MYIGEESEHGNLEWLTIYKFCAEVNLSQKLFYCLIKIINLTKKKNITYYTPLLWGGINGRLGRAKFNSLQTLLDYRALSSTIHIKRAHKLRNNQTKHVCWSTHGVDFITNFTSKI